MRALLRHGQKARKITRDALWLVNVLQSVLVALALVTLLLHLGAMGLLLLTNLLRRLSGSA